MELAIAVGTRVSTSRAACGSSAALVARRAARRSSPAPIRRERSERPSSCRVASLRAASSLRSVPTKSVTVSAIWRGAGTALVLSCERTRGPRRLESSRAVPSTSSSSAVGARSVVSVAGGFSPNWPTTLEGAVMSRLRSACRVAASRPTTTSSTRMSCSVEPSGASSRFASSRAAFVWPTPSRSTSAVAAVYDAKPSDISISFAGESPLPVSGVVVVVAPSTGSPREGDRSRVGTTTPLTSSGSPSPGALFAGRPSIARSAASALGERSMNNRRARYG